MNKLHAVLLLVLVGSCLALVKTAYETRRLYSALDEAQREARKLDSEHKRLDAERQAQATHTRVEKTARTQLAMRSATPERTLYVQAPAASAPTAAKAAGTR